MVDSLFIDIITFAFLKVSESSFYYSEESKISTDRTNKLFLRYLDKKKRNQLKFIKKIAEDSNVDITSYNGHISPENRYLHFHLPPLKNRSLKELYTLSYENAKKELEFFQFLTILQKNSMHNSLIITLIDLTKDFLFDVKMGYINLTSGNDTFNQAATIDYVLKNE